SPELWQAANDRLTRKKTRARRWPTPSAGFASGWSRRLQELLAEKEAERERVTTLFRRGHISRSEAGVQLDAVGREIADLRALIDSLAAQVELAKAWEARVVEATVPPGAAARAAGRHRGARRLGRQAAGRRDTGAGDHRPHRARREAQAGHHHHPLRLPRAPPHAVVAACPTPCPRASALRSVTTADFASAPTSVQ